MKKEWLLAMCATAMMASCAKDKTVALDNGGSEAPEEIILGAGQYLSAEVEGQPMKAASRGIGSVGDLEATNDWNGETVYVYGIVSTLTGDAQFAINGEAATAPKNGTSGATVTSALTWSNTDTHYYYDGNNLYDFYGCHVDDAATDMVIPTGTDLVNNGFSVPVTINGTQDLMVAMPDKNSDITADGVDQVEVTTTDNLYSAWSSRRGVKPNLVFKHVLTRLTFKAKCGNATVPTPPVKITSIQVTGAISEGTLTIIPANSGTQGFVAGATTADFALMAPASAPETSKDLETFTEKEIANVDPDPFEEIGAPMMLVPGEKYTIVITTEQDMNGNTTIEDNERGTITKEITFNGGFLAGANYNINITVYGLESIDINATLTAWTEGGNIEIDPDDINPPTPTEP